MLKRQHGAEKSALARNIYEGWVRNRAKKEERTSFRIFNWRVVRFMPGRIDMVMNEHNVVSQPFISVDL